MITAAKVADAINFWTVRRGRGIDNATRLYQTAAALELEWSLLPNGPMKVASLNMAKALRNQADACIEEAQACQEYLTAQLDELDAQEREKQK